MGPFEANFSHLEPPLKPSATFHGDVIVKRWGAALTKNTLLSEANSPEEATKPKKQEMMEVDSPTSPKTEVISPLAPKVSVDSIPFTDTLTSAKNFEAKRKEAARLDTIVDNISEHVNSKPKRSRK